MEPTIMNPEGHDALSGKEISATKETLVQLSTYPDASLISSVGSEISGPKKIDSELSAENASFNDSAYVSSAQSNIGPGASGSSGTSPAEEKHTLRRGKVLLGTGLTVFEAEIDKDTNQRYTEVMRRVFTLLAKKRQLWTRNDRNPGDWTIRIMVLGSSEADISPYLVIFCSPELCGKVGKFLKSKRVKELYEQEGLKIQIVEHPPRQTSAVLSIDVCLKDQPTSKKNTFCGLPILFVDNSGGPSRVQTRKATFGGVIEVTFDDGRSMQYGLTAGHAVEDLLLTEAHEFSEESDDEDLPAWNSVAAQPSARPIPGDGGSCEASFDAWGFSGQARFATVIDNNRLHGVMNGTAQPLHDWALIHIDSPKPNVVYSSDLFKEVEERFLMVASRPAFSDGLCDPVLMMTFSGLKNGRLSSLPGAILRGRSTSFVQTYMLELDEGQEVCEGDSGAWVAHTAAPEVYGHVVATDILGDVYVMPSVDTFDEIRACMGARSVKLPDCTNSICTEPGTTNASTKYVISTPLGPQNNSLGGRMAHFTPHDDRKSEVSVILPQLGTFRSGANWEPGHIQTQDLKPSNKISDSGFESLAGEDEAIPPAGTRKCEGSSSIKPQNLEHQTFSPNQPHRDGIALHESSNRRHSPALNSSLDDVGAQSEHYLSCRVKRWDPIFTKDRAVNIQSMNQSYVQLQRKYCGNDGNSVEIFFQNFQDPATSYVFEEVHEFCSGASLKELEAGIGMSGSKFSAWLDVRSRSTLNGGSSVRRYMNPLTASSLYKHLEDLQFDNPGEPDADRRLIYISNLNRYCLLAIIETVPSLYSSILRDAIWKHMSLQTSLRAAIPTRGFKIFQLEFHFTFYVLETTFPTGSTIHLGLESSGPRLWTDLSFLQIRQSKSEIRGNYGMFEANFSVIICGIDDRRWTAYAFDDTLFNVEEFLEMEDDTEGILWDPISSSDFMAGQPIWNPREYFLKVLESRLGEAAASWESLIRSVERSIWKHKSKHSINPPQLSNPTLREQMLADYDYFREAEELLRKLRHLISKTIAAWAKFDCLEGDIGYFTDLDCRMGACHILLCEIREIFQKFDRHQQTLDDLSVLCRDYINELQFRLTLEASTYPSSSTSTRTDFVTFVLFPLLIAATSSQLMPLQPWLSLFVLTVIFMIIVILLNVFHLTLSYFLGPNRPWIAVFVLGMIMKIQRSWVHAQGRSWSMPAKRRNLSDLEKVWVE